MSWTYRLPAALMLLAPFNLLASLGLDIYLPVVPLMPGALASTPATIQLTLTLYMIMLGLGQMLFGPLSDRVGRRPVLIGGVALFAAASFALAATSSAPLFLALRLVQAAGASAMLVALFATVRDVYAGRPESTAVYGLLNAMLAVALAAWHETRMPGPARTAVGPILRHGDFWRYTLAFGTAMGTFFVFFSTAPRVLIGRAGLSEMAFSLAFATVALVMIATSRLARPLIARAGIAGSVRRGMALLILGAGLLCLGRLLPAPSVWSFVLPMWPMAAGIVMTAAVTANGALRAFDDGAGTAVALHFCVQSLITGVIGTTAVVMLDGETIWPLAAYATGMAALTLIALRRRI